MALILATPEQEKMTLEVLRLDLAPGQPSLSDLEEAVEVGELADRGIGLTWGVDMAERQAASSKRTCVVYDSAAQVVLWMVCPTDIVFH